MLSLISIVILVISLFISYKVSPNENHEDAEKHGAGQIGLLAALALFGVDYYTSFFYASGEMMHALHPYGMEHYAFIAVLVVAIANFIFGFLYMFSLGPFNEGGGSYTAAMRYLGPLLSLIVAITLIEDYVLTIVVSALSGADQFLSVINAYNSSWVWHFLIGALLAAVTWFMTIKGRGESAKSVFTLLGTFTFLTITMAVGLIIAYITKVPAVPAEIMHQAPTSVFQAFMHLLTASMKGLVALTGLEAMSNGIQFVKNEDANIIKWGKEKLPKLKGLWEFYSGKSGVGRLVQTSFLFYGGITTLFLVFFSIHFNVFDGTLGKTLVGNLAFIGFNQIPGGNILFWFYQFLAVFLLAAASMTAFQDAQATEWRDVAIGAIPEVIVKRDKKGTFTRSVTFTFIIAVSIMLLVKGKTSLAVPFYGIGVFLPISIMGFAMARHFKSHLEGTRRFFAVSFANFAGLFSLVIFLGQLFGKWEEGGWIRLITFTSIFLVAHYSLVSATGHRTASQIHRIVRDKARVQGNMASIVEWQSLKMQEYRYQVIKFLHKFLSTFNIKIQINLEEPDEAGDYDHSLHLDHPEAPSFLEDHITAEVKKEKAETHGKVEQHYTSRVARNSIIIPIADVDEGTLEALRYAKSQTNDITVIHIATETTLARKITEKWDLFVQNIRLVKIKADINDKFINPLTDYIKKVLAKRQPNQVFNILIPQEIYKSPLKKLFKQRTAQLLRLKLSSEEGIFITDIPYVKKDNSLFDKGE